jgi:hypothetical protein
MTDATDGISSTDGPADDYGKLTTAAESLKKTAVLSEVQDTVSRLSAHHGVTAVFILNSKGDIVTQTGDATKTGNPKLLTKMLHAAASYVNSIHDTDSKDGTTAPSPAASDDSAAATASATGSTVDDTISFVRLRAAHDEILVAPKFGFTLVVFQNPTESTL